MRKIAVVTGSRSEYGPLKILMEAIDSDEILDLLCVITGMHLLPRYGNTYKIVKKDFPKSYNVEMNLPGDSLTDMGLYLADGIKNFTIFFDKTRPDIVVVAGDRTEALAASLAALYLDIPIAHINGGDVTEGMIDDSIRNCITKLAHIHLAHTLSNADRIRKMGEDSSRIYVTGTLAIEAIIDKKIPNKKDLFNKFKLDVNKITYLVVQHPIPILNDKGYFQMSELLLALDELKNQTVLIYPNCDAGSKSIIGLIEKYEKRSYLNIFKNLDHDDYIGFLNSADVMIGNSSSGIIEAPTVKTPVINIGERQSGRDRSINIVDVNPDKNSIIKAVDFVLKNKEFKSNLKNCKNKFGVGDASNKIVDILKKINLDDDLLRKK